MAALDEETVEAALTQWATGQLTQQEIAAEYGISQQYLQRRLRSAATEHLNTIQLEMWRMHKEHGQPYLISIPRHEALHQNAAFYYATWIDQEFKKLDMNIAIRPFEATESDMEQGWCKGDIVLALVDVDFMAQLVTQTTIPTEGDTE